MHALTRTFSHTPCTISLARQAVTEDTNLAVVAALIARCIPGFIMPRNYVFIGAIGPSTATLASAGCDDGHAPFDPDCLQGFIDAGITHIVAAQWLQVELDKALAEVEGIEAIYVGRVDDLIPYVFAQLMP